MKSKIITVVLSILMIFSFIPVKAMDQEREFTSLDFNSSQKQFVSMNSAFTYIPNTMEVWAKLDTNPNKRQVILGNYRGTTYPAFSIEITADNQLRYFEQIIENGKKVECDIRTTDFSCNNQWTHITVVRDSTNKTISLLVNGTVRASKKFDVVKEKPALSNTHFVGTDHRKSYFLDSEINSISLWNQTKTEKEVLADMEAELTGTENGLYHAWNFNEASLTATGIVYDLVAENKINATVPGFEILAQLIQKLKDNIIEYEHLISESNVDQKKKDVFISVINDVKNNLEKITSKDEIKKLTEQLEKAYSDFGEPSAGKLDFVVLSDTHVQSSASSISARNYDSGLNKIVTTLPNAKAVVNCGDFSSDGADSEFARYYSIIDKYDENLQFVNALGNHDVRWTSQGWDGVYGRYMSYNQKYMGDTDKVYYDTWIGEGEDKYHFIVLNTEWDIKDSSYISNEQLEWLDKTMAEGAKDDKPIFVTLHQPLRNTIADTDSYNGSSDFPLDEGPQDFALKEVLRKYPQSIILTGHVHAGLGENEIVETDYGTLVSVPSYLRPDSGDSQNQLGYYVSVYDGKVQLSMYDFEHDRWLPDYHYTVDLTDEIPSGKVLDVTFDDETANDVSGKGNHGTVVGNVEYVDGVKGKAIHIVNNETDIAAKQYVDFGNVEDLRFGEDDFTIMFWYKGTKEMDTEGAIISNKNWDSGSNKGFAIGTFTDPRPGIGLNFTTNVSRADTERYATAIDAQWHHITATFNRNDMMTLYIDGKALESSDISGQAGMSIDVDTLSLVLGADGNKQYPINDGYIDELKIYKKVIGAYELESVVAPYNVKAEENKATITWDILEDKFCPAYILFNGEKLTIPSDATSYEIAGLTPNKKYTIEIITRDKVYTRNLVFGHEIEFKTVDGVKVDFEALKDAIVKAEEIDKTQYTQFSIAALEDALVEAKALLGNGNVTQEEVDTVLTKLQNAIDNLVEKDSEITNKTALSIAIDMAKEVTPEQLDKVVPAVANEFKAALQNAQTVYAKDNASQEEVDNAFNRLAKAMQMLEFYKGDKAALQKMMDQITNLKAEDYTETSWKALQAVLPGVNEVLGNANAMQDEVDEVYTGLVKAFINLRLKPNKDLLNDLINQANGLNRASYTESSLKIVDEELVKANAVLKNPNATEEEVTNAVNGLTKAMAGLETNPVVDNNVNAPTETVKPGDNTVNAIKTGDDLLVGVYAVSIILGITVLSILGKKRLLNKN